jgi:hypothetical protein
MDKLFKCLALQLFCTLNIHAQQILPHDLIINEVLFNPVKDGYDYVEVYNRGNHPVTIDELLIANRNATDEIASVKNISKNPVAVAPSQYFVITANETWLKQHYAVPDSAVIIQVSSLPSWPDDEGCIVLMRKFDSAIIDELRYNEKWHFKMISNPEGVALERINYELPGQDQNNWMSASSSSGSGTPGYVNSQFRRSVRITGGILIEPSILSPNNDGQNDFASINIKTATQGNIVNAVIFNALGKRVRYLLKNELLGVSNTFTWDGYDDRDQLLPSGIYILSTQIFDATGRVFKYRNCIVLNSFPP